MLIDAMLKFNDSEELYVKFQSQLVNKIGVKDSKIKIPDEHIKAFNELMPKLQKSGNCTYASTMAALKISLFLLLYQSNPRLKIEKHVSNITDIYRKMSLNFCMKAHNQYLNSCPPEESKEFPLDDQLIKKSTRKILKKIKKISADEKEVSDLLSKLSL